MAAQDLGRNYAEEKLHAVEPDRLIGIDARGPHHAKRQPEQGERRDGEDQFSGGDCKSPAITSRRHCVST
jgi:hypothetical protein